MRTSWILHQCVFFFLFFLGERLSTEHLNYTWDFLKISGVGQRWPLLTSGDPECEPGADWSVGDKHGGRTKDTGNSSRDRRALAEPKSGSCGTKQGLSKARHKTWHAENVICRWTLTSSLPDRAISQLNPEGLAREDQNCNALGRSGFCLYHEQTKCPLQPQLRDETLTTKCDWG